MGTVRSVLLWGFQICNQFHDRVWIGNDTAVFDRQSRTKLETIFKVQRRSTPLSNCRMVNSYTCVILWVVLEAYCYEDSKYVINFMIVCQMAEIHANHRPTSIKYRGDWKTDLTRESFLKTTHRDVRHPTPYGTRLRCQRELCLATLQQSRERIIR